MKHEWTYKNIHGELWTIQFDEDTDKAVMSGSDVDWEEQQLENVDWILDNAEAWWVVCTRLTVDMLRKERIKYAYLYRDNNTQS